jgi:lysozyme
MLLKDLAQCGEQVQACVTVPLSDNQFAALASFVFNVGIGNFKASTVMKRLNNGEYDAVPTELSRWVKATNPKTQQKVTLPGLVARRAAEGMLWLTGTSSDDFLSSKDMPQQVHADDPRITCTVIARDGLRVRAGAGVGFDILKVLACDTKVYLLQEKDGWAAIDIEGDGAIDGWVSKDFLRGRHG